MSGLLAALAGDAELEAILSDATEVAAIVRFEVALAEAEAELGLIDPASARAIGAAAAGFVPDWPELRSGMARDGVVVPALLAQFRAALPEPHRAALHWGATSQDAIDTALMLRLAQILPILLGRTESLRARLVSLNESHGGNRLMAHTRMQAALPFTVADKLRSWDDALGRHHDALLATSADLLVVQLGGPIGDRSSFHERGEQVAGAVASRLNLGVAPPWHTARDRIVGLGARLAMLAGSLGKIGADVAAMAQTEVGAAVLSAGGSSSAMSHKNNPINAEVLVALAHYAAGLSGTLNHAMVHDNERSGAAWTLEWLSLPPLIVSTGASLLRAELLLAAIVHLGDDQ